MVSLLSALFLFSLSLHCFVPCLAATKKNITTDESALLAFKSLITSDPNHILANNWSTSYSVCNWVGVTCDEKHNRVHTLNLTNMRLRGTVSPNLGNMSFLVILDLSYNSFGGQVPFKEICWLRRLKFLRLSYNEFNGEIPATLGNLSQLEYLKLGRNNFSGLIPQSIGNFHRLKILALQFNMLSGPIPQTISNMSSLEEIYLYKNNFSGPIPEEIHYLDQLEILSFAYNGLSGSIPSKLLNMSSLKMLFLAKNNFSGIIPSNTGYNLPRLQYLHLNHNSFVGNIPNSIFNSSMLIEFQLNFNAFSGTLPNIAFGNLRFLESIFIQDNDLTIDDSLQFFTSLSNCRYLKYLALSRNQILPNLPKSIGNITSQIIWAESCGIDGNIPLEVGNMSKLLYIDIYGNKINGPIPGTFKRLHKLQGLDLGNNSLQGSFTEELCEIESLSELYLENNKLFGVLPTCLGNMTYLRKIYIGSNNLNSMIPSSLWSLKDILEINLSSNAFVGNIPPEIGNLRAITLLDLSRNQISSNIPSTISFLKKLEDLSLADNKLNGSIPTSLGDMVGLMSLDLSQNMITGVIPKSLESLSCLQNINLSYNRLQGEIPDGGPFKNFTAQSFMHNEALCGNHRLQVPQCDKQAKKMSMENKVLLKCILPIVVSAILVVAIIILLKPKKVENTLERGLSTFGAPRRISYYELVQATNGFNESNLLGKGGFGSVYKGKLPDGEMIAVKVIDLQSNVKSKSFDTECNAMKNLRHRNLVKIISGCSNLDFKALVMEFMSNGSVDKWLYSHNYCLNFIQRLNIMIDVASALEYLHHGSSVPVVHCDLKPTNVLLDENMVAHVSDFGIAKLMDEGQSKTHTQTLATIGYLAPEYGSKGIVSVKGDVYSYGIMLMEIFTRRKPTDDMFSAELSLKTWISQSLPNSIMEVMDYSLIQQNGEQIDDILTYMKSIFGLALSCCKDSPEARINMANVTVSLIKIKTLVLGANRS
ncbi:non-specific serine/threonine protein kinase [Trifolium repens]|nr:non-specific serine/threonine protein kinase [Trifolium repens]